MKEETENFTNCKFSSDGTKCTICRDNYYLNKSDHLCYDNTKEDSKYYKCISIDNDNLCEKCANDYHLTSGDRKCTISIGCKNAVNSKKCIECDEYFCLDVKKGICVDNDYIENASDKFYINCNRTNEEGTACEECLDGYEVSEEGYCIDVEHCEKRENGICVQCQEEDFYAGSFYFANSVFNCLRTFVRFCVKCNNITDLFSCTECEEGFELNEYGICI